MLAVWAQSGPTFTVEPGQLLCEYDATPGQDLVFVGVALDPEEPARRLDPALLTDAELLGGPDVWVQMEDPLPPWVAAELPHAGQVRALIAESRRRVAD